MSPVLPLFCTIERAFGGRRSVPTTKASLALHLPHAFCPRLAALALQAARYSILSVSQRAFLLEVAAT